MATKVLQTGSSNCITILTRDHERSQLNDVRRLEPLRPQNRHDVREDQIGLLSDSAGATAIGPDTKLARDEEQLGTRRDNRTVTVKPKWRMQIGGVAEPE